MTNLSTQLFTYHITNLKNAIIGLTGCSDREVQNFINLRLNDFRYDLGVLSTQEIILKLFPKEPEIKQRLVINFDFSNMKENKRKKFDPNKYVNANARMTTGYDMYGKPFTGY